MRKNANAIIEIMRTIKFSEERMQTQDIKNMVVKIKWRLSFENTSNKAGAKIIEIVQFLNINLGIFQNIMTMGKKTTYKENVPNVLFPKTIQKIEVMNKNNNILYFPIKFKIG